MTRFRDPQRHAAYEAALLMHDTLMVEQSGRGGAYRRGWEGASWPVQWTSYPVYAAGRDNRAALKSEDHDRDRYIPGRSAMTSTALEAWIGEMIASGRARNEGDCARLLDIDRRTLWRWKRAGVPGETAQRTALAARAVLAGLEPYAVD